MTTTKAEHRTAKTVFYLTILAYTHYTT